MGGYWWKWGHEEVGGGGCGDGFGLGMRRSCRQALFGVKRAHQRFKRQHLIGINSFPPLNL